MTGCANCDEKQNQTNNKSDMCADCEIALCEQTIATAMDRIEQLKKIKEIEKCQD